MDQQQFERAYEQAKSQFTPFLLDAMISEISKKVEEKSLSDYTEIRNIVRELIEPIDLFGGERSNLIEIITMALRYQRV